MTSAGLPTANALGAAVVATDNGWPMMILAGATPTATGRAGNFMALEASDRERAAAKFVRRPRRASGCRQPAIFATRPARRLMLPPGVVGGQRVGGLLAIERFVLQETGITGGCMVFEQDRSTRRHHTPMSMPRSR